MLVTVEQAAAAIRAGKTLLIAGDQKLLSQLPQGAWIGGSIPYFIDENGGVFSQERVFVTELDPRRFSNPIAASYTDSSIPHLLRDASDDSLTFLIVPFGSTVHRTYAKLAPDFDGMFIKPVVGWVAGVALYDLGTVKPTVVNGFTGEVFTDRALALCCDTPPGKPAKIGIANIFQQGTGDTIEFLDESFDVGDALVNGKRMKFSRYLLENKIDTRLPLVANFSGAMINVSVMSIDETAEVVHLYAPVFKNIAYKVAASVGDYSHAFGAALESLGNRPTAFSCNCILNYLYGELEGKKTGRAVGPITFGEIAYQLVNQTFVYVEN